MTIKSSSPDDFSDLESDTQLNSSSVICHTQYDGDGVELSEYGSIVNANKNQQDEVQQSCNSISKSSIKSKCKREFFKLYVNEIITALLNVRSCCNVTCVRSLFLVLVALCFSTLSNILTPLVATTSIHAGSDPYIATLVIALFECVVYSFVVLTVGTLAGFSVCLDYKNHINSAIIGFCYMLNMFIMVSSGLPNRTPPYLQGILFSAVIPTTMVLTILVLKKAVSKQRLACTGVVIVGLFICSEPRIWNLKGSGSEKAPHANHWFWPLSYGLAAIPQSVINIWFEREFMKNNEVILLVFNAWCVFYQFVSICLVFWVDLIPMIGMADNFHELFGHMARQLQCTFSAGNNICGDLVYVIWCYVLCDLGNNLMTATVVKYCDGAMYYVITTSLVSPLVAIFWNLFRPLPYFHWEPQFTVTTAFTAYGLVILVPAVFFYCYLSAHEERELSDDSHEETIDFD